MTEKVSLQKWDSYRRPHATRYGIRPTNVFISVERYSKRESAQPIDYKRVKRVVDEISKRLSNALFLKTPQNYELENEFKETVETVSCAVTETEKPRKTITVTTATRLVYTENENFDNVVVRVVSEQDPRAEHSIVKTDVETEVKIKVSLETARDVNVFVQVTYIPDVYGELKKIVEILPRIVVDSVFSS